MSIRHPSQPYNTDPSTFDVTAAARVALALMLAAGWPPARILDHLNDARPDRDAAYEARQVATYGEVRIGAAAMCAEMKRLLAT